MDVNIGACEVKKQCEGGERKEKITAASKELLNVGYTDGLTCLKLKLTKNEKNPLEVGKTFRVSQSSVLDRVRSFLPRMAEANESTREWALNNTASDLDIENTDNCTGKIIEMDLALVKHTEDSYDDSSQSESDTESCDYDDALFGEITENNIQLQSANCGKSVHIEELAQCSGTLDSDHS